MRIFLCRAGVDLVCPRKRVEHCVEKKDESRHRVDEEKDEGFLVLNRRFRGCNRLKNRLERLETENGNGYIEDQQNYSFQRLAGVELAQPREEPREHEGDQRTFFLYGRFICHEAIIYTDFEL